MKRYAFYMLVMAVAAVAACQKQPAVEEPTAHELENQEPATPKTYTYTVGASIEDAEVKSNYDADGKFSWSSGDAISVLFHKGDANKFFTLTTTADGTASASFSGEIEAGYEIGASDGTDANKRIFALYPASANHTYTAGNYPSFYTPAVNDLSGGKFSANIPMYALNADEGDFSFGLMTCAYKFTITDLDVSKIQVDVVNNDTYYLSGLTSMSSSGYLRYDGASKNISYICDVTAKTAVFYLSCRYGNDKHFKPTITIKDYNTDYTIKSMTASNAVNIDSKKVQRLTISAPGMGSPFVSTLGIDWYGSDASIVSANGDAAGVKVIKAKADAAYLYIMFGVKKSLLLYREASYPRSNNIQLYFNSSSPGHFCYLYRNGVAQINDASASALSASQIVELEKDDSVFCEFKVPRTYSSVISATGSAGVKVCVFYDFWVDNEWGEHSDWGKYVYSPEVTVTLP